MYFHSLEKISQKLHLEKQNILRNCVDRIIFHVFLRIIAFLQTPGSDTEGSMTGIIKAWTLKRWVGIRHECCLIVPETSPEGNSLNTRRSGLCQCSP